ncbi:MAG: hypothetical protein OEW77_00820 [Gemmatimonadota bacterium]|nr:hypothetical protein [Gemmatimonadota bacterium]
MSRLPLLILTGLLLAAPVRLASQERPAARRDTVPPVPRELLPPPGTCRIWVNGVPAKQQPAPTDCATAVRQNPSNGIVLYGPAIKDEGSPRFEFSVRAGSGAAGGQAPRASLVDRRDSLRSAKTVAPDGRNPSAKDSSQSRSDSVRKPVERDPRKPEQP